MWKKIGFIQRTFDTPDNPGGTPPAEVQAPWAGSQDVWKIGEGETAKSWHDFVPEPEAKAHLLAKGYKNPAELALANYNLTRLQTGDPTVVGMPAADAPAEAWNQFYNKLGRPETPDKYEIKMPEGMQADEGMLTWAKPAFHEAGLTPKQAQILSDKWNAYAAQTAQQVTEQDATANQQAIDKLNAEWGADLEKNKEAGKRAMAALGIDADLVNAVEQHIGSAPIVKLLALIGRKADEGGFIGSQNADPNNPDTMTKEQAQARVAQLQGDADFMRRYGTANDPGHAEAVKTMERLFARL